MLKKLGNRENNLKIDAGTLFFDDKLYRQPQRTQQALITASTMVHAFNHMKYDAVAIARQDLTAGLQALKELEKEASFPFLSANIVDMAGDLLFKDIEYLQRSEMRIALIGLTGHTQLPESCIDDLKILPWQSVLPDLLQRATGKSDFTIILSNLSAAENMEIAKQFKDVHLILQSGVSKQNLKPQLINNTIITQSGHDGKYQGQLTVNWAFSQKWQQANDPFLTLRREYDRLGWLIGRVQKKGGPEVVYKKNKAQQKDFARKLARYQKLEIKLEKMTSEKKDKSASHASYNNHFHPLPPSIADDQVIMRLLQQSRQKANQIRRKTAEAQSLSHYTGSNQCKKCHEQIYSTWAQTPHASAYETLAERDQNNNLTCVFCHVTGLDENNAYLATSLPDSLKAVGCETCHGPGKRHAENPKKYHLSLSPDEHLCLNCHTPDRDDNFNYQVKKELVH